MALLVGDVVGHGVAACAAMGQLRAVLSHALATGADALARLRAYALVHRRPLIDVALDVVARRLVFTQDTP